MSRYRKIGRGGSSITENSYRNWRKLRISGIRQKIWISVIKDKISDIVD